MPNILKSRTAVELMAEEDIEEPFIVDNILVRGAITNFSAKIKTGKTTFIGSMLRKVLLGEPFLSFNTTHPVSIVYCTEEGKRTFKKFLLRTGLAGFENLHIIHLNEIPKEIGWKTIALEVKNFAMMKNALVVIFDTFPRWAKERAEEGNSSGFGAEAMEQLEDIRALNIAVLAVFHDKKSGGDIEDSTRGTSAYGGAADILLQLAKTSTNGHPNRRKLNQTGRLFDNYSVIMDWNGAEYVLRGKVDADDEDDKVTIERDETSNGILQLLSEFPDGMKKGLVAVGLNKDPNNQTFRRAVDKLADDGLIIVTGSGKNNDPYFLTLPQSVAEGVSI